MVSYIKGGTQAKGIWKQDPEANILMRMENGEVLLDMYYLIHFTMQEAC